MNRAIRTLVLAVAGAVALSSAGTALAAYTTPKLLVTDASPAVTINYTQDANDDPTAKLTFYAPTEYSASLTQPAGQTIGTVTASVRASPTRSGPSTPSGRTRRPCERLPRDVASSSPRSTWAATTRRPT